MEHKVLTKKLIKLLNTNKQLKLLVEKNLEIGKKINPDKQTNPAQSLEELYDFFDWATECMPWNVLKDKQYPTIYEQLDKCTGYFWFIFDHPLDELKDKGYYYPSLNYYEPIKEIIKEYSQNWGNFLSKRESWNDDYFNYIKQEKTFGFSNKWYSEKNIWNSFNEFFSRKLISSEVRPISNCDVICPADSLPQGFFKIDKQSNLINDVYLKSAKLYSVSDLIGKDSKYSEAFAGGTLTHTFLDINDYHRYHFPVSGEIVEIRKISGANAGGGITEWNAKTGKYEYYNEIGFQMIETRDCIIIDTEKFGLVAILPVGMSQICSCNWEDNLKVNMKVTQGQPMGYFMFGGSDIVMIFQKNVKFMDLTKKDYNNNNCHLLMGEKYANLEIQQ